MYWSITTLATIGYGDITPCNELEMLFVSMSHILGSALFAYVVGGIATIAMTVIVLSLPLCLSLSLSSLSLSLSPSLSPSPDLDDQDDLLERESSDSFLVI